MVICMIGHCELVLAAAVWQGSQDVEAPAVPFLPFDTSSLQDHDHVYLFCGSDFMVHEIVA